MPVLSAPSSGQNEVQFSEIAQCENYSAFWPLDGADDTGINLKKK